MDMGSASGIAAVTSRRWFILSCIFVGLLIAISAAAMFAGFEDPVPVILVLAIIAFAASMVGIRHQMRNSGIIQKDIERLTDGLIAIGQNTGEVCHLEIDSPALSKLSCAIEHVGVKQQDLLHSLRSTSEISNQLMASIHEGVFGTDLKGRCLFANEKIHRMLNRPVGGLIGENMHDILHVRLQLEKNADCGFCRKEEDADFKIVRGVPLRMGDEIMMIDYRSSPSLINSRVVGSVVSLTDVTHMAVAQRNYESLVRQLPIGIYRLSLDGRLLYANKALLDMFGGIASTMLGTSFNDFVVEEDRHVLRDCYYRYIQNRLPFEHEYRIKQPGGEIRHISSRAVLHHDLGNEPVYYMGLISDVTELKQVQLELSELNKGLELEVNDRTRDLTEAYGRLEASHDLLRRTQDSLVEQEKLAALGRLVAGVAHEINTPIGVCLGATTHLMGQVATLRKQLAQNDDFEEVIESVDEACDIVVKNIKRAADTIRSFKSLSTDQMSGDYRTFDIVEVIKEVVFSLSHQLRDVDTKIEYPRVGPAVMHHSPGVISQIVTILITNSVQHGFGAGGDKQIEISIDKTDDNYRLTYRDNGSGIQLARPRQIFEPFYTTSREVGGSGLGLHILHNLVVHQLGGAIAFPSDLKSGFSLVMTFPVISSATTADVSAMVRSVQTSDTQVT